MAPLSPAPPIQPLPQFQKIIHTERRTTSGNSSECVGRGQVCDIDQKGFQSPIGAIIKNTLLSPTEMPTDHLILIAYQRMKRMGDAESTGEVIITTCSC